jgi:catechol 2,3-dioxygenase-like lactoylglutathione lyase family enzyme
METFMLIKLTSIMVDDQDKALRFYTEVLGFQKKREFPVGAYKWLTVVSPEAPDEVELTLEPNANPAAKTFQQAMFSQGIPLAAFQVSGMQKNTSGSSRWALYSPSNRPRPALSRSPCSPTPAAT